MRDNCFRIRLVTWAGICRGAGRDWFAEATQLMALFLFNIGIEVGQLGIIEVMLITPAFCACNAIARCTSCRFVSGGIASYWFIEELADSFAFGELNQGHSKDQEH